MDLKPIHIVDTLAVTPDKQMALLKLIKEEGIPVMQDAPASSWSAAIRPRPTLTRTC